MTRSETLITAAFCALFLIPGMLLVGGFMWMCVFMMVQEVFL